MSFALNLHQLPSGHRNQSADPVKIFRLFPIASLIQDPHTVLARTFIILIHPIIDILSVELNREAANACSRKYFEC